ncbi:phosphatase PAP2 family protein [Nocardioides sp. URHA0020]|uniref:phosphatase PAP2 family protein n=1 Tax=Nocardioides sp. URHA0020 TaxID=1380392 RepID=UPI00049190B0|nr:phosphatase PAP2 family protein [Nocardioides sp. URHA0020]
MSNPTKPPVRRRPSRRFVVVAALAALAILIGLVGPTAWTSSTKKSTSSNNLSAKDRIAANPPPTLFADSAVAATDSSVAAQRRQADAMVRTWATTHGAKADDQAFIAWVEQTFPPPPADLAGQMPVVVKLSKQRTTSGIAAATWLESYGKKDIWKLYAHDQAELLGGSPGRDRKAQEKAVLKMAKKIADDLGTRYGSAAPYVRMPSLRTDHKVAAGQKCPCSYPSRHATAAAASETLLGTLMPAREAEYRAMEAQIDYSRIYMAGHFPGDIAAGALLGDVIGDYFLLTRNLTALRG